MGSVNDSQKLDIINLYNDKNLSQKAIGEIYGISGQLVSRILRRYGCETNVGGWREKRSVVKERHLRIIQLHSQGKSLHQIADIVELSVSGVSYVVDKYLK